MLLLGDARGGEIYSSKKSGSGKWGTPKNLGKGINTSYFEDGYLVIPQFLNKDETTLLHKLSMDDSIVDKGFDLVDQTGKKTRLTLWFTPGDDTFGLMSRSQKMVSAIRFLLGQKGEICHFHSKVID